LDKSLIDKYLEYASTDEAYAILFVKKNLNASLNKWVDILSYDHAWGFEHQKLAFKSVTCELFERCVQPKYPKKSDFPTQQAYEMACRAITWNTAHEDIERQRARGVHGRQYQIAGRLIKRTSIFVDDTPEEIKVLEKNLNDRTSPLWDVAFKYMSDSEYDFEIKYVKRIKR